MPPPDIPPPGHIQKENTLRVARAAAAAEQVSSGALALFELSGASPQLDSTGLTSAAERIDVASR